MSLSHEHVGSKIQAKINTFMLTRAELLIHLCYEIPCISNLVLGSMRNVVMWGDIYVPLSVEWFVLGFFSFMELSVVSLLPVRFLSGSIIPVMARAKRMALF